MQSLKGTDESTPFVLLAPFLACLHAKKEKIQTYGRRREQANFAACEQQISQTSLRVRAD